MTYLEEMLQHAQEGAPNEVCGLVVSFGKRTGIIKGRNIDSNPRVNFTMDPEVWLQVGVDQDVVGIYHSHPVTSAEPSMADLTMCEASGMPWHIVNPETKEHRVVTPSGYAAPYEGRPYVYGIFDCYTLGRDWYMRQWGIELPAVPSDYGWWDKGANLYLEHYKSAGFYRLTDDDEYEFGDVLLIQHGARVPNHMAVYLGDGKILHHLDKRMSKIDFYGGAWLRGTTHRLRHTRRPQHG